MKKLITIILILALAVPALSLAEEEWTDPIIGCWYYAYNQDDLEPDSQIPGVSIEVYVLNFNGEGIIKQGIFGFGIGNGLSQYRSPNMVGTWIGIDGTNYNMVYESQTRKAYIEGDVLYVEYEKDKFFPMRRIVEMSTDDLR